MISGLRISAKLLVLVGALLAAMVAVGGYGLHALQDQQQRSAQALQKQLLYAAAVDSARVAEVSFKLQVQEWKNILLRGHDAADRTAYLEAFRKRGAAVLKDLDALERGMAAVGLPVTEVQDARRHHATLAGQYQQALQAFEPGRLESSQAVDRAVRGKDRPLDELLDTIGDRMQEIESREAARAAAESEAQARTVLVVMAAVVACVLLAGALFGLWIARGITRPLQQAVHLSRRVAAGDLTVDLQADTRDEVGELLASLSEMNGNLRTVVGEVVSGSHAVADSSAQIAQGNVDLSQRTEEQASTLEETASQMEELTSTVAQNADNARQASLVAAGAAEVARKGGAVVGQVVQTMDGISQASRRIADIISVIDGIAFQTNILALNAAVEAARAGEQGRGFAVVAAEVRNLAQRSAAAAREIKTLIGDSVGRVDEGTRLVGDAGRTMEEIVASVKKVSELIAEIAAASQEQTAGIEQVNTAVTQMDQVVQQNASLVEEATAATESMKAQAGALLQVVARFKLRDQALAHAAAAAQPARARLAPGVPLPGLPGLAIAGTGEGGPAWREF